MSPTMIVFLTVDKNSTTTRATMATQPLISNVTMALFIFAILSAIMTCVLYTIRRPVDHVAATAAGCVILSIAYPLISYLGVFHAIFASSNIPATTYCIILAHFIFGTFCSISSGILVLCRCEVMKPLLKHCSHDPAFGGWQKGNLYAADRRVLFAIRRLTLELILVLVVLANGFMLTGLFLPISWSTGNLQALALAQSWILCLGIAGLFLQGWLYARYCIWEVIREVKRDASMTLTSKVEPYMGNDDKLLDDSEMGFGSC